MDAAHEAFERQRRLRIAVEMLTEEIDARPQERHFHNTLQVMQHRLAEAMAAMAAADEALRVVVASEASLSAAAWGDDEARWPGPSPMEASH